MTLILAAEQKSSEVSLGVSLKRDGMVFHLGCRAEEPLGVSLDQLLSNYAMLSSQNTNQSTITIPMNP